MLTKLLSKDDNRKYQLLYTMDKSDLHVIDKADIKETMNLSEFLLKKTIEQIEEDTQRFQVATSYNIFLTDNTIRLETDGSINSHFFFDKYLGESISFKFLEEVFLEKITSINEFSLNHFLSYPKVYNMVKDLRKLLKSYGVSINNKLELVGEESAIRIFFIELFNKVHYNDFSFYRKLNDPLIAKEVEFYKTQVNQEVSVTDTVILEHFITCSHWRNKKGHPLTKTPLMQEFAEIATKEGLDEAPAYQFVKEHHLEQITQSDFAFANLWLGMKQLLPPAQMQLLRQLKGVRELNQLFVKAFKKVFVNADRPLVLDEQFMNKLSAIHTALYLMAPSYESFFNETELNYFQDNYPELFYFCQKFIAEMKDQNQLLWDNRVIIFYQYLFLLSSYLNDDLYLVPVNVYIDFSFGKSYNQLIGNNMKLFQNLGLQIHYENVPDVDIILSDNASICPESTAERVVWLSPPNSLDWVILSEKIVVQRNLKIQDILDRIQDVALGE